VTALSELKLFERLLCAKKHLRSVQSKYRVIYEPSFDTPLAVLIPDPNWLAQAFQGGILPPVEVYLNLQCHVVFGLYDLIEGSKNNLIEARSMRLKNVEVQNVLTDFKRENQTPQTDWFLDQQTISNAETLHEAPPIGAMNEAQAIEYLVQKDVPVDVWGQPTNRQKFKIINERSLPKNRKDRNAWSLQI